MRTFLRLRFALALKMFEYVNKYRGKQNINSISDFLKFHIYLGEIFSFYFSIWAVHILQECVRARVHNFKGGFDGTGGGGAIFGNFNV